MKELENKVKRYMKQHHMVPSGGQVIAGVSGGADSVCLLMLLWHIGQTETFSLKAIHVHHGLRGEEADRDEEFVRELCGQLQVPFKAVRLDVPAFAKEHGISTEEAGRILRYKILEQEAEAWDLEREGQSEMDLPVPFTKIAVAHQQEDQGETILHNLLRGTGLKGLSGIQPVSGRRIRPLLDVSREEIIWWLRQHNMTWCEDSTNKSDDYTRNRIRHLLFPLMREQINEGAMEHIIQAGSLAGEADLYLEEQAQKLWEQGGEMESGQWVQFPLAEFRVQPKVIRTYLIRRMFDLAAPGWKNITYRHFSQIEELAIRKSGSGCLSLPCGLEASVDYTVLRIGKKDRNLSGGKAEDFSQMVKMECFQREKADEIPKNQYTKWFDYDKIKDTLSVRTRQEGDYICLSGGGRKKLSRLMIDEKIPSGQRDNLLLLTEGKHVLWVIGYRISEYYKVTDSTKTVLQVTYDGGKK